MTQIFFAILFILFLILILSGKARILVKGFFGLFITNVAKTPEGAEAIYQEAIEEAQLDYNKANDTLNILAGKYETAKKNLAKTKEEMESTKNKCEQLAKSNEFEKLDIYSTKLDDIRMDLDLYVKEIEKYKPMYEDASLVCNKLEATLKKLKKEKSTVVAELRLNNSTKEMYDRLDELKHVKSSDKLLSSVREGLTETSEKAIGAKTIYNNKTSTKIDRIEQDTKSSETSSYIQDLKNKYKK